MFLLLPTTRTKAILGYCLGYVCEKYSVELHEFIFLSNHYHLVVTDPRGELPAFMRDLNSLIARALNSSYGRWEAVWSSEPYCAPVLCDAESVLSKCIYTLCNANEAGLVRYVREYDGLCSWGLDYGSCLDFARPDGFFSSDLPSQASVILSRPKQLWPGAEDRTVRAEIRRAVREREGDNACRIRAAGGAFLGMKRVLRQRVTDTPSSRAPRRGLRPRVAGRSRWARIEALERNARFQVEYRAARLRFDRGERNVEFPLGTYKLRVESNVRVGLVGAGRSPP
ncbi:MAG: transposase [Myxococcota bacterium]